MTALVVVEHDRGAVPDAMFEALTAARPAMMKSLEGVREYLGLIHPKIGVAQAMSGPVVAKVK